VSRQRTAALIDELLQLQSETACVEFKENNADAPMIGKLISALSNTARLADQPFAYVLWGVRDGDHAAVGTTFEPSGAKQQGQPLELWLAQRLQPSIAFNFKPVKYQGASLVLLEIPATASSPVEFDRLAYIRIDSATSRLSDHPERLKALWAKLQPYIWEAGIAAQFLSDDGLSRADTVAHRLDVSKGYAIGFSGFVDYIDGLIPRSEYIGKAFRRERSLYPAIAIRELGVNALYYLTMKFHTQYFVSSFISILTEILRCNIQWLSSIIHQEKDLIATRYRVEKSVRNMNSEPIAKPRNFVNEAGLNDTPFSERIRIGIFGRRNSGKSRLMNAITGQRYEI